MPGRSRGMARRTRFANRRDGGRHLAGTVVDRMGDVPLVDPVVLGLPRGGVPVAAEVAAALGTPLDVVVARKIGAPGQPELAIGAVAEGSPEVVRADWSSPVVAAGRMTTLAAEVRAEVESRVVRYRRGAPLPPLSDRDVVVVDDGLATGLTAEAALRSLRRTSPRRLVLAVPVGASDTVERLAGVADLVITVLAPARLGAVGVWYDDFAQTTDDEVLALLSP